jgi:predicted Zn-dependent protease
LIPTVALNATPTAEHAMLAQRARVLSNPGVDALHATAQEAKGPQFSALPPPKQAGVLYGAALASSRLREFEQARTQLKLLTELVRTDARAARLAHLLSVEVALAFGDKAPAAALLAMPKGTTNKQQRPELLLAAQAMSQNPASLAQVSQALQAWVNEHPRDAQAWQLLSDAYTRQNQPLRSLRASAESQVAMLDYGAALDRFKAAQNVVKSNSPADHIDASIIDTRRRQVELLLKEQALDR